MTGKVEGIGDGNPEGAKLPDRIWVIPQSVSGGVPLWDDGGEWFTDEPPPEWGPRAVYVRGQS
jgi:hypothetical protein